MPNHVQNVVRLQGNEKRVKEILEAIKNDQYGIGSVDFEKIIPIPPPLHIECGGKTDRGLNAYRDFLKSESESEKEYLDQKPNITPEEWEFGKQAYENICEYGAPTWYEWSIAHWGTKWNAYGMSENTAEKQRNELRFQTAWAAPHPILEKLAQMYPQIAFEHEWADEDISVNCGRRTYQDRERFEEYYPEGNVKSTEFALSVWGYDASDLSLILNTTRTKYINMEMKEYELIELFGEPALFSNERMTADDIPNGLYCYHLRHTDNGDAFATIEPSVKVNCAGSVITDKPIDFGGTWLSDYVPNRLGGFLPAKQEQESQKPECPLIGQDGNIFNLMGIASQTLRRVGLGDQAKEMCNRIRESDSYDQALGIIGEYVNITSVDDPSENDSEEMEMNL